MASLPRHHDGGCFASVCTFLLLAVLLLICTSRCSASCQLCHDTGNCSSALGPGIPGFFCSLTTINNSSNASAPLHNYSCCSLSQVCTVTHSAASAHCAASLPSSSASAGSAATSSPSPSDIMSDVFIGLSLLFAAFLLMMTLFMCVGLLWMAAGAWKRRLREGRRLKSVLPMEGEDEQRERQRREQTERAEREREEERREERRRKEQRRRDEQAQLQAVLERARQQVERKRRELRDEAAQSETTAQQRTADEAASVQMVSLKRERGGNVADEWSSDEEDEVDATIAAV